MLVLRVLIFWLSAPWLRRRAPWLFDGPAAARAVESVVAAEQTPRLRG